MTTDFNLKEIAMNFYNTASRKKEKLSPIRDNHFRLYTCGPTVYNFAHIGNFRTYVFEDILRRTIKFFGYGITQVMNLTDVDDKTIRGAIAGDLSLESYTKPFIEAFFEDLRTLHIEPAEHYPSATHYIPEMIEMIKCLMVKEIAYKGADGSIYYAINKFSGYGCLSHLHLENLQIGASERVGNDEYDKENAADFVLWKSYEPERDGKIFWESPFGRGRPGWHLECSAMAMKLLGETLDIHVGGVDNIFPHHENEIAQSEACSGQPFVNHWMHVEHLLVDQKKMSKSLGNIYTLRDLIDKGYTGLQVRYLLLQAHYRMPLNFTFQGMQAAKSSLERLNGFIQRLYEINEIVDGGKIEEICNNTFKIFSESLADDLNISSALASLFDLVRVINGLCDAHLVSQREANIVITLLRRINSVLGVMSLEKKEKGIPPELIEALEARLQARLDKDWKRSDELRDYILERGYRIEDTPQGPCLQKN